MPPMTLQALYMSSRRLKRKQHIWMTDTGRGSEVLTSVVPYKGMNMVAFSFMLPGLTQYTVTRTGRKIGPIPHHEIIAFQDCKFSEKEPDDAKKSDYFRIEHGGDVYWVEKINPRRNRALVRCDCKDYYFTASYWNFRNGCQWGPPAKPYIRKTTTYPERNPMHIPFMCKHIFFIFKNFMLGRAEFRYSKGDMSYNITGKEFFK